MLPDRRYFIQRRAKKNLVLAVKSIPALQNGKDENETPIGQGRRGAQKAFAATQEAITNFNRKRKCCLICFVGVVLNGLYLQESQGFC